MQCKLISMAGWLAFDRILHADTHLVLGDGRVVTRVEHLEASLKLPDAPGG